MQFLWWAVAPLKFAPPPIPRHGRDGIVPHSMIRHAAANLLRRDISVVIGGLLQHQQRLLSQDASPSTKKQGGWASFVTIGVAGCAVGVGLQQAFFLPHGGSNDGTTPSHVKPTESAREEGPLGRAELSSEITAPSTPLPSSAVGAKSQGPWIQDDAMNVVIHRR